MGQNDEKVYGHPTGKYKLKQRRNSILKRNLNLLNKFTLKSVVSTLKYPRGDTGGLSREYVLRIPSVS